ncbi:MAG: hypothetical protein VKI82_14865 [Leptolyngbya sp.]|nr:hypothetical protein [Leptolyngbya sp.]
MAPSPDETPNLPQGPGFGLTFLYYFVGTALITALLATQVLDVGLDTGIPNQFGLLLGAVGGLVGASLNRSSTLTLTCPSQKTFQQQLTNILAEMGYHEVPDARDDGVLVFQRAALRQVFSGRVYVLIEGKTARLSSRTSHIRRLRQQLEKAGIR